jgi:hypothetical protein
VAKSAVRIDHADLGILSQQLCCVQNLVEQRVRRAKAMFGDPTSANAAGASCSSRPNLRDR